MTRDAVLPACLGGSLAVHLLFSVGTILYLAWIYDKTDIKEPGALKVVPPRELTLVLPDMLIVEEKKPEEKEIVETRLIDTAGNEAVEEAPENAPFESDRNTRAASENAPRADGDPFLPSVDGKEMPAFGLKERKFSDGEAPSGAVIPVMFEQAGKPGATANEQEGESEDTPPEPKEEKMAEPPAKPGSELANVESFLEELANDPDSDTVADKPGKSIMEEEGFQKLIDIPEEELVEPKEEVKPEETEMKEKEAKPDKEGNTPSNPADAAFQMSNPKSQIDGKVNNPGEAAVDAAETPLGKYARKVKEVIGRDWHFAHDKHRDFSTAGFLRVEFYIRPDGTTEGVRTTELKNNVILESLTLDVILKAKLPPPPEEVLSLRADRRVYLNYGFYVSP